MENASEHPPPGHARALLPLVGLLCLVAWIVPSYVLWRGESLTPVRFLGLGLAGSACWLVAGTVLQAQRSSGIKRPCLIIGVLALAIWFVPAALFPVGEGFAVRVHLLIWGVLYLGGLVYIVTSWLGRFRRRRTPQVDPSRRV